MNKTLEQKAKYLKISPNLKTQKWTCVHCWKGSTIIIYNEEKNEPPSQRGCTDATHLHKWKKYNEIS